MDFSISEETRLLQKTMRDFVEKDCFPIEQGMMRQDPDWVELPPDIFQELRGKLRRMGMWALDVPPEYGGKGLDTVSYCLVTEEQYRTTLGTAHHSPFWGPSSVMLFPALYRGTPYQKENYLLPLIRGEKRAALAQTEPEAGADAAAIKTTATRDGADWVIEGTKRFCTMADRVQFLYVTAVTDKARGRDGISVFLVDTNTPGLRIGRIIPVIRPQYSTELVFANCRVPDRQRLEGSGWEVTQEGLGNLRMLLAQGCVGRAVRAVELATSYVQRRVTFGQPLATRQAIQWMLADSAMEIHLTRLLALEGAWKVDQGQDVRQEASMIKVFATEMCFRVLDRCIQCFGGLGVTKELPLERWFREMRVLRIGEGPSEVHRMVIARNLLRGWRP